MTKMGIISSIKTNKTHLFFILAIAILGIIFMRNYAYGPYYLPMRSDDGPDFNDIPSSDFVYHASNAYVIKESLGNMEFPLWSKYTLSGMPMYAKPQVPAFNLTWLLLIISPTSWLGLKWSFLAHFLLAGMGMYLFMEYYFKKGAKISFFAALIYMFNGNLNSEILVGHFNILNIYAFLPFILLFIARALSGGSLPANSIISGVFTAFLVLGGSPQESIFALFLILFFVGASTIGKNFGNRLIKSAACTAILLLVFFGLSAVKVLPTLELLEASPRQSGLSYDSLVGGGVFKLSNFIEQAYGIFGILSIFLLASFANLRKKRTLLLISLLAFAVLMLSKSFLIYFIWKHAPFVNKMRGIYKALFMFIFPASALIGAGTGYLIEKLEQKFNLKKLSVNIAYSAVFLLVFFSLIFPFQKGQKFADLKLQLEKNQVMQHMSNDDDIFRFKAFETNGIDWGTDFYSIPLGLQDIYGYENIWLPEYMPVFLSAANSQPAKFFGMLNMKYMTSMNPLNMSGFALAKKFEECGKYQGGIDICQPRKSDGPYLYRNEMFLPRAFFADNSILALGDEGNARNAVFYLLASKNLDPSNTVVISQETLEGISPKILESFDVVLLVQTPRQNDLSRLRDYSGKGRLIPDIFSGQANISVEEQIERALSSLPGSTAIKKAEAAYSGNHRLNIDVKNKEGFLVLSEQYSQYPGWKAISDGEEIKILKADNILTSVYVEKGKGELKFEYHPHSFAKGLWISLAALCAIISYFAARLIKYKSSPSQK